MSECENCKGMCKKEEVSTPNVVINFTYIDNRVEKDESNYVDNVTMLDSDEE